MMTTNGILTNVVSFDGTNGATPLGPLVQGVDGNFYGTASSGGVSNLGSIFLLTANGTLTNLLSFTGTNGDTPTSGMLLGGDGNFYGTTYAGGAYEQGTFFQMLPDGTLNTSTPSTAPMAPCPTTASSKATTATFTAPLSATAPAITSATSTK